MSLIEAQLSLQGLSVGDAFGECFFRLSDEMISSKKLPAAPWPWTDDTQMALHIVEVLAEFGEINQDVLAQSFVRRFLSAPWRGYGSGAYHLLRQLAYGAHWRQVSTRLFKGGSFGNGAAMHAAPMGGFFAGDATKAALQARLSAEVTHAHPEG